MGILFLIQSFRLSSHLFLIILPKHFFFSYATLRSNGGCHHGWIPNIALYSKSNSLGSIVTIMRSSLALDTWTRAKWAEWKTVVVLFLDVRSAYRTVNPASLIANMKGWDCPAYPWRIIKSFRCRPYDIYHTTETYYGSLLQPLLTSFLWHTWMMLCTCLQGRHQGKRWRPSSS